jgi:acyl-CoA thioester hydrolase
MTHRSRVLVLTTRIPIRWGDMDALGHVNNTVYFRYMEQARIEWSEALVPVQGGPAMLPLVIVNASCTFLRPLVYPGDVEIRMFLGDLGRTSVGSDYEMTLNGELCAQGAAKIVWIDPATGRPAPLPAIVAAPLRALAPASAAAGAAE